MAKFSLVLDKDVPSVGEGGQCIRVLEHSVIPRVGESIYINTPQIIRLRVVSL